jgi:hypothetical protein
MSSKKLVTFAVGVTLATISLGPTAAFAQFPPSPPMGLAGPPHVAPRAGLSGPAPRLGLAAGPRADLAAAKGADGAPSVVSSARIASFNIGHSRGYGYQHGGPRYASHAAMYAGAYAAGAYAGYAYGGAGYGSRSESACYYIYRRSRRILVCD